MNKTDIHNSQIGGIGDNWHIEGGIHFHNFPPATEAEGAEPDPVFEFNIPFLPYLVGREEHVRMVQRRMAQVREERRGLTMFLTGLPGSGRHALARRMQTQHRDTGWALATLRFPPPGMTPEAQQRIFWQGPEMAAHGERLADLFPSVAEYLPRDPWLHLMAQLVEAASLEPQPGQWLDEPQAFYHAVRRAARRRPLLLTIEYLDHANPFWIDLLYRLIDEVRDYPVLLLITLTAPAPIARLDSTEHTEPTRLAETVAREVSRAQVLHLDALTVEAICEDVAPTNPQIGERLFALSDGDPLIVAALWQTWRAQGAVYQEAGGDWQIDSGEMSRWLVFGELRDHAQLLLQQAMACPDVPEAEDVPLPEFSTAQVQQMLNCAAVEAAADPARVFTAQAVAQVLELDAEDVMDYFDAYLLANEWCAETTNGDLASDRQALLEGAGFTQLPHRRLCHYRFAHPYLYHVWAKYPELATTRRAWAGALGDVLERAYHPYQHHIPQKLYDLFMDAGLAKRAGPYRQQHTVPATLQLLAVQMDFLMTYTPDDDCFGTYRLFDRGFALCNELCKYPQHHALGLQVARQLYRRATLPGIDDRRYQARACYYATLFLYYAADYAGAYTLAQDVLQAYETLYGPRHPKVALALGLLGMLLQAMRDLAGARPYLERALAINEAARGKNHPDTAVSLNHLGSLLQAMGDLSGARLYLERAIAINEASLDKNHLETARSLKNLGVLLQAMGDLSGARPYLERELAIREAALESDHPDIAVSLINLGRLLKDMGDLAGARPYLERALAIRQASLGPEHPHTAASLGYLGELLKDMGDLAGAHQYLRRAMAITEASLGPEHLDPDPRTAHFLSYLGELLLEMGDLSGAGWADVFGAGRTDLSGWPYRSNTKSHIMGEAKMHTMGEAKMHTAIPERPRLEIITYVVQPGDTIEMIADKFGLQSTTLQWSNPDLEKASDLLNVGQELTILPLDGVYHTVDVNDTLSSLAETYKVSSETIASCQFNTIPASGELQKGQKLIIPDGTKPYMPKKVTAYEGPVPEEVNGSGYFRWPAYGTLIQSYWYGHRAIDIGAAEGSAVRASDKGYVSFAGWTDIGYGYLIVLDHANGYQTYYAHLSNIFVVEGQVVEPSEVIGAMGNPGNSIRPHSPFIRPHLHFEIRYNNYPTNPLVYLP